MNRQELIAAAVVAHIRGGRFIPRDVGGKGQIDNTRDFDIVFEDSDRVEPLEVTSYAREAVRQSFARMRQVDVETSALGFEWAVVLNFPDRPDDQLPFGVRECLENAVPALVVFEQAGAAPGQVIPHTRVLNADPVVAGAARTLCALGITLALASPRIPGKTPRITLAAPVGGRSDEGELVTKGIEIEAGKEDNLAKLSAIPSEIAHIFVLVDGSTGSAASDVANGRLGRIPKLPSPITTAWITAGSTRVFSVRPPEGWREHEIPMELYGHPERWQAEVRLDTLAN